MIKNEKTILLFDVDGTLTKPRQKITAEMLDFMKSMSGKVPLAIVGGSDIDKIFEQLGSNTDEILNQYSFVFAENGLTGFRGHEPLPVETIASKIGEEKVQELINFCLKYMSEIKLPKKRGQFVEYRKGMINVSPIGRSCTQAERDEFVTYESANPVRQKFVDELRKKFSSDGLTFSIGGQISIDIFPTGWDKSYCLKYLDGFEKIHFFGDKTLPGGNDYEIFAHERTVGHSVRSPEETRSLVAQVVGEILPVSI